MIRPAWLDTMAARVFVILLVGIVTAAALAFTLADLQRWDANRRARELRLVDRIADLAAVLDRAPPSLRPALLGAGPQAPRWASAAAPAGTVDERLTARLAARLGAVAQAMIPPAAACGPPPPRPPRPAPPLLSAPTPPPPPAPNQERGGPRPPAPACRLISLTLASGARVAFIVPLGPPPPRAASLLTPVFLAVLALGAAGLAWAVARVTTAPLRRLSVAAAGLGRDLDRPPMALEGPSEVRQAAQAFNIMQTRLKRDLEERTHMLAAITHDLQTPMTRLRLRLEKVSDAALRAQLLADQAAMLELIRDGLDLARASGEGEKPVELDVDSLLHCLCEDAAAAGADVSITGRCDCAVRTRPQALKRCVANLLDNALKYAGSAELSARRADGRLEIRVRDHGPGIPEAHLPAMLEPFVRLEASRSRETGGVGLGLTIARILAERSGGDLKLANRPTGGLDASVSLALDQTAIPRDAP